VDLEGGRLLDVVADRTRAAVAGWLHARPHGRLAQVSTFALDPWRLYQRAGAPLDHARVVDHFHAIRLANTVVDQVRRRTQPKPPSGSRRVPVNGWIQLEGRPIARSSWSHGVFEGSYWEYLAFRTDRGEVCGQWHNPNAVQRLRRSAPGRVVEVDGRQVAAGGGCGFVFGTSGFRDGNRTATDFEASLPARYARVRMVIDGTRRRSGLHARPVKVTAPGRGSPTRARRKARRTTVETHAGPHGAIAHGAAGSWQTH
jgi:hypothetical protein